MTGMNLELNNAPGWRPEPGDVIIGKVIQVDRMRSSKGAQEYYPVLTIEPEDKVRIREGEMPEPIEYVAVHCFHAVLKSRVLSNRPAEGERIGIKFVGKQPTQDGARTVAVYNVKVEGRDRDPYAGMSDSLGAPTTAPASDLPVDTADFSSGGGQNEDDDIPF